MKSEYRLQAYVDGELDAAASAALEAEMADNAALRANVERLRALSAAIRDKADYYSAPRKLKARYPYWKPLAAAAAVLLAFGLGFLASGPGDDGRELVASHARATLSGRLIDVASSDQHTVKPWLSSRLAFSPPVVDLSQEGFELAGARVDYLGGQSVAVLVYRRRQHVVEVFVRPDAGAPLSRVLQRDGLNIDGFNIEGFVRGGMLFRVVSDLNRRELGDFAALLAARS
jgi:anti-sigma factor RsiW